jgi:hypothetical protein
VRIGESIWRVEGRELPRGTRVRVLGCDGTLLKVAPALAFATVALDFDLCEAGIGDLCATVSLPAHDSSQPSDIAAQ